MGVEKGGRSMAANSEKTAKIRGPGQSGNPRGRPPLPPNAKQNETISGIFYLHRLAVGGGPVSQNPLP